MKKVGIVTFHQALNYGAVLQAFALQNVIQNLRYEVKIIDYMCPKIVNDYKAIDFSLCKTKKDYIRCFKYFWRMKKRKHSFMSFLKEFLKLTERYDCTNINKCNEIFDIFVTGSDQVFNDQCTDLDKVYFLDFVEKKEKKVSYAASFGFRTIPNQYEKFYRKELSQFKAISVREKEGKKIVEEVLGQSALVNVDPTLALEKSEWMKLISTRPVREKYIFVYTVMDPKELLKAAQELAQKVNCKIVYLHGTIQLRDKINPDDRIKHVFSLSPQEFINYIYYAEYVLTNSFHGTVFSCIFRKKFGVELETLWKYNGRSKELLGNMGLENHIISNENYWLEESKDKWEKAEKYMKNERKKAVDYLREVL